MSAANMMTSAQIGFPVLVVSSDEQIHSSLDQILRRDCRLHRARGRSDALSVVEESRPWVVLCDQTLADGDWRDLLADLQAGKSDTPPVIVSSRCADDRLWAEVLNLGGYDLLASPFTSGEVSRVVEMAARRRNPTGGN